jgi:hypothetical protein
MKKVLIRLAVCLFLVAVAAPFGATALAQDAAKSSPVSKKISGVVLDADGLPVIGAGVIIAGNNQRTITDE